MTESVVIKSKNENGAPIQATFLPENGLRLVSLRMDGIDVLEEGLVIGPYWKEQNGNRSQLIPWKVEASDSGFKAEVEEKNQFKMLCQGQIGDQGLILKLSVIGVRDAVIGMDCRFPINANKCYLTSDVQSECYVDGQKQRIPEQWDYNDQGVLKWDLSQKVLCAFRPKKSPLNSKIQLTNGDQVYQIAYSCCCEENAWILDTESHQSVASIIPMTSQNPWYPNLTVSSICIALNSWNISR